MWQDTNSALSSNLDFHWDHQYLYYIYYATIISKLSLKLNLHPIKDTWN